MKALQPPAANTSHRKDNDMAKTILVIDDDEMNLRMAELILTQSGYQVTKANSGMAGITAISERRPELVLLDIEMPVMNVFQTLEKIRSHEGWQKLPVMMLTASADTDSVLQASKLGAIGYVKKPFMPQDLLSHVKKALDDE